MGIEMSSYLNFHRCCQAVDVSLGTQCALYSSQTVVILAFSIIIPHRSVFLTISVVIYKVSSVFVLC